MVRCNPRSLNGKSASQPSNSGTLRISRCKLLSRPLCRNVSGIFVVNILEDFARDFPGGFFHLSGPVRGTPPYRAIPFRDSIAEGGIARVCLVFIGYRAGIAAIPLLGGGGYRTSTSHALQGAKLRKGGRGIAPKWPCWDTKKPIARDRGGIAESFSRYRARRGPT